MIGVIDYGLGNLNAFINIYKQLNIPCKLVSNVIDFEDIDKAILPGVGAFDHAISAFINSGLLERSHQFVKKEKKPVLGICVGMQMMANSSEEGEENGLGWIGGEVNKLEIDSYANFPLPHIGWNLVHQVKDGHLFNQIEDNSEFYFLHSYYFQPKDKNNIVAESSYPNKFTAVVAKDNVYGIQCHPEKSHAQGVQLLKNFAELC